MTSAPPSLLALHMQRETRIWELEQKASSPSRPSYASSASTSTSTVTGSRLSEADDAGSVYSIATTVDAEDPDVLPNPQAALLALLHQQHQHQHQPQHIPVYGSWDEAAAHRADAIASQQDPAQGPAQQPRRLTTPGKLYENEEDDDEIVEDEYGDDVVATG